MQFKVPQDVLRPDKIVGFLTLRQLIIVALGGGIAYSLYVILSKQYVIEIYLPPVAFVTVVTLAFAFLRFRDLPFEKLVLIFIEYKFRPRKRPWLKMRGDTVISVLSSSLQKKVFSQTLAPPMTASDRRLKLEEITKLVDTHGKDLLTKKNLNSMSPKL